MPSEGKSRHQSISVVRIRLAKNTTPDFDVLLSLINFQHRNNFFHAEYSQSLQDNSRWPSIIPLNELGGILESQNKTPSASQRRNAEQMLVLGKDGLTINKNLQGLFLQYFLNIIWRTSHLGYTGSELNWKSSL